LKEKARREKGEDEKAKTIRKLYTEWVREIRSSTLIIVS
jgi:hypothetical protein